LWRGHGINIAVWLIAAVVLLPLGVIAGYLGAPTDGYLAHLAETVLPRYLWNTILLLLGVGVGVLVGGVGAAWLVSLCDFPGRRFFGWALVLPFALPAYVIAYTYTGLLDAGGPVQAWLREDLGMDWAAGLIPEVRSLEGAIVMLVMVLYPYVYLLARAAFIEQSVCAFEVSRTLGCSPWLAMRRVALPLARPSIAAGTALALMEALNDFGTVQFFGVDTFTTGIFRVWEADGRPDAAAQLSVPLLIFVFALLAIERWSRGRARYMHMSTRYRPLPQIRLTGLRAAFAILFCAAPVLFGFAVPTFWLLVWTVDTAGEVIDGAFWELAFNTFFLAGVTACVAVAAALVLAYSLRTGRSAVTRAAVRFASMGYAIPGAVLAVGLVLGLGWVDRQIDGAGWAVFGKGTGLIFTGSAIALVIAYTIRFLPIALGSAEGGLSRVSPHMDDAARNLGRRPFGIVRQIHMPLIGGSLWAGGLLVFVDVVKELPATLLLRPFNFDTLAVRTYEYASDEQLFQAAPSALAIVLVGLVPVLLLNRMIDQSRAGDLPARRS
jgi:iron(III) transport system permease protein